MADMSLASFGLDGASLKASAYGMAQYVIWGLVILGIAIFGWLKWQDKKVYIYPVRIYRQRNNGQVKELNTFGGYVKKGQFIQFLVKQGAWKKKAMDKLPLSEWMDEDNRVYYWQVSPDAPLIQVKRDFLIEKVFAKNDNFVEPSEQVRNDLVAKFLVDVKAAEGYKNLTEEEQKIKAIDLTNEYIEAHKTIQIDVTKPTFSPVATDLKQQALNDINNYKNTLGVDVNKQFAYFVIGVIALVIVGVIIFYIAVNKGDIPILTK